MRSLLLLFVAMLITALCSAQQPVAPANYDETKVPKFELPDPLKTSDGRNVDTPQLWNDVRRPELLKFFEEQMFGKCQLPKWENITLQLRVGFIPCDDPTVFNGKGKRIQMRMVLINRNQANKAASVNILVYLPNNVTGKVPAFLGLNFEGNHTVADDPGITLGTVWKNKQRVPATEEERGSQKERWQIEKILDRGYAVITAYYQDFEPDFDGGSKLGFRKMINQKGEPNEGNAIAMWAWGLCRIYESFPFLEDGPTKQELNIDYEKIAVIGHSRLGKTALWAGAIEPRFAMVISNNSGCCGAALSRREYGETVHRVNTVFPQWYCGNFKKYSLDVNSLPFDQHELIALIAPRPIYIASAVEDQWADPKGEFLGGLYADPVYRLLGTDGIAGVKDMPGVHQPVGGTISYHIRDGVHEVTEYDWEQYLNFADKHLKGK
jgi:hypothetical protein